MAFDDVVVSAKEIQQICVLRGRGLSEDEIARRLALGVAAVRKVLKAWRYPNTALWHDIEKFGLVGDD